MIDHYHGIVIAECAARERNQRLEAAAKRWAQYQELPTEPTLRQALAERLLTLDSWIAPEHTLMIVRHAASASLVRS